MSSFNYCRLNRDVLFCFFFFIWHTLFHNSDFLQPSGNCRNGHFPVRVDWLIWILTCSGGLYVGLGKNDLVAGAVIIDLVWLVFSAAILRKLSHSLCCLLSCFVGMDGWVASDYNLLKMPTATCLWKKNHGDWEYFKIVIYFLKVSTLT